ncbi:pLS20_p028 family conjugation system transmembrane protein [Lactobacillus bombicola]|uniref:DUF8208 domain-containing protein n=1 Tax=Lactobacillus bombicola TaxID=1505723 RepID=A0A396SZ55_9LACO|nr:hypothetical protein [Lactobacillus bombicola]RHW55051.1 hypothetical protein DS835_01370 [Lactobacillus bombicola]
MSHFLSLASVAPTNALHSALKYLNYSNIFTRAFSTIKWWIISVVYGIANATSEFMNQMLNLSNFVDQVNGNGEVGNLMQVARYLAGGLMVLCLIWIAIKIIIDHHAPQIKNVIVQLFISAFLITNIGNMTTWLTSQSVSLAQGLLGTATASKVDKGTSALPFNILKSHVNDLEYMIDTNFAGTNVSSANALTTAPAKIHWGLNNMSRKEVDNGEIDFTEILDNEKVKDNSALEKKDHPYKKGDYDKKPGTHFLYGWLKYTVQNTPKENGKGTTWNTTDIWHLFGFSMGGYQRFTINFLPVFIALLALTIASLFAGYAIVKSFIDIVGIDILSTVITATDLDTGQKTKRVITSLTSAILLVSLQAFEFAFYQAACTWANASIKGVWGFAIFMLAATVMLITGNSKVAEFFNVDTGAQRGLRAMGSAFYLGQQSTNLGAAVLSAPGRAKNKFSSMSDRLNTTGSIQRAAKKQARQGARQNAINKMAGFDQNGNRILSNINNSGNGNITTDGLPPLTQTPQAMQKTTDVQNKASKALDEAQTGYEGFAGKFARAFGTANNSNVDNPVNKPQEEANKPNDTTSDTSETDDYNPLYDQPINANNSDANSETNKVSSAPKQQGHEVSPSLNQTQPKQSNNFATWKKHAAQYDKYNGSMSRENNYEPINFNPITKMPYTESEWKQNLNNVRSNGVPTINLDGTKFTPTSNSNSEREKVIKDRPISEYTQNAPQPQSLLHQHRDNNSQPQPPRARK